MSEFILKHPNYVLLSSIILGAAIVKLGKEISKGIKSIHDVKIDVVNKDINVNKKEG